MLKRLTSLFLALAIVSFAFAQEKNVVKRTMKIPTDNISQTVSPDHSVKLNKTTALGELFINTAYDYAANSIIPKMVALADIDGDGVLDPMFTAMQRTPLSSSGPRLQFFGYKAFGVIDAFNAFDPALTSVGWGTLEATVGGPLDGNAMVMAHAGGNGRNTTIDLVNLAPVEPFGTGFMPGNFPDFVYLPDGTIFGATTNLSIYKSTDQGVTFDFVADLGDGDSNVDITNIDSPSELPIYKSDDGLNLAFVSAPAAFSVDTTHPDVVYWYGSNDGGASWNGLIIGEGSGTFPKYGQVANNLDYAPYFTNFAQTNANIDNNGTTHVVANGYGERITSTGDTTNYFPIVYWNSDLGNWYEVSIPEVAEPTDGTNLILDLYPGNGIGQAYPTVSVSADGQVVLVMWAAPEFTGAIGASDYNIYPGDGGTDTAPRYYTDLHWTVSVDGGQSWSAVTKLGEQSLSETYPSVARRLDVQPNGDVVAHFIFYVDPIPGTSLFAGENGPTPDGSWQYLSAVVATITGVEDEGTVVNNFKLEQNYPNPFNPSTKIKYSVAERSNVSIKVFDMLGKEVTTLVNTSKEAGSYEVSFDASNLASGLYVYTINAGNFTSSKKMMLLK